MVYHYGTFVFKQGVTPAQIDRCFAEMRGMVGRSRACSPCSTASTKAMKV